MSSTLMAETEEAQKSLDESEGTSEKVKQKLVESKITASGPMLHRDRWNGETGIVRLYFVKMLWSSGLR